MFFEYGGVALGAIPLFFIYLPFFLLIVATFKGSFDINLTKCPKIFEAPEVAAVAPELEAVEADISPIQNVNLSVKNKPRFGRAALVLSIIIVLGLCGIVSSLTFVAGKAEGTKSGYAEGLEAGKVLGFEEGRKSNAALILSAQAELAETTSDYKAIISEYNFYHERAAICTPEGYRYHHYGCGHLVDRSYYIYNIQVAKAQGYTPCLDCWKPDPFASLGNE
ncbi:MAG: hypothetical protein RR394_08360 [Oscillospiraceae bacterium]